MTPANIERNAELYHQWAEKWKSIGEWQQREPWEIGDLFNEGRQFFDESRKDEVLIARLIQNIIPKTGVDPKKCRKFGIVARVFDKEDRQHQLSFQYYEEVWKSGVDRKAEQRKWLALAEKESLSTRDLRVAIAESKGGGERKEAAPKYGTGFVLVQWADAGAAGLRELFPHGKPIDEKMRTAARVECGALLEEMQRIGIIG